MSAGNEQTELRALADRIGSAAYDGRRIDVRGADVDLLRRAADRLDRLTAYAAGLEEDGICRQCQGIGCLACDARRHSGAADTGEAT